MPGTGDADSAEEPETSTVVEESPELTSTVESTDNAGRLHREVTGRETDPVTGADVEFQIAQTIRPDGSGVTIRDVEGDDGSSGHTEAVVDADGNVSASGRHVLPDGSVRLVTRTEDPDGHGTEQVTTVGPDGEVLSDTTTTF